MSDTSTPAPRAGAKQWWGLAILVMMKRNVDSVDVNQLNRLKW